MTKPRLVLIEWLDSRQPEAGWQHTRGVKGGGACKCQSVGWLIKDGKKVKVLAANMADGHDQVSAVIRIPACCVVRMSELVGKP